MSLEEVIDAFADAIATAEGYYVAGSRASRNNNPGNLTADIAGGGVAIGTDGPFTVYATAADGWADLKQQIRLAFTNASRIYNSNMTIFEFAQRYTTTDQLAWASNVASKLGVSLDTRLSDLGTVAAAGGGMAIFIIVIAAALWFSKKGK